MAARKPLSMLPCPLAQNGAVHVRDLGLVYNPATLNLRRGIKAHFRDPFIVSSSDA